MALSGTLADFGLPDIFQLLGHQQKTGILELRGTDLQVRIHFVEGNVVKAEEPARDQANLLGNMIMRAGAISPAQLEAALATQQRTLRRIGDILIEMRAIDRETLRDLTRLQATETIYRLFLWRQGTYEFTATSVETDRDGYEPIRAENILMEGFRMVDEWPAVRRVIPTAEATFVVVKGLPERETKSEKNKDLLAGMADLFGGDDDDDEPEPAAAHSRKIGDAERKIFPLVAAGRTVQDIVDLSRMGDFEGTKALATLVQSGVLRLVLPAFHLQGAGQTGFSLRRLIAVAAPALTRVALYIVVAVVVAGVVRVASTPDADFTHTGWLQLRPVVDKSGEIMRARLGHAIEAFRFEQGRYPVTIDELALVGLVEDWELTFPYEDNYPYRVSADGWALALPLR